MWFYIVLYCHDVYLRRVEIKNVYVDVAGHVPCNVLYIVCCHVLANVCLYVLENAKTLGRFYGVLWALSFLQTKITPKRLQNASKNAS